MTVTHVIAIYATINHVIAIYATANHVIAIYARVTPCDSYLCHSYSRDSYL